MLCQFERLIFPRDVQAASAGGYMVALYRPCEAIRDSNGNTLKQVKAVGYYLPMAAKLRYNLQGRWAKAKHGLQYEVERYDEVIVPTREGILAYLASGQIKGIGPKIAERIYDAFGETTLEVLDREPERLLQISGISKGKLKKIQDSYLASRNARDVVAFLAPYGITPNRAVKLYREYGEETMDIVMNHPYRLCELTGIGFRTADKVAMSMGFDALSPERVDEGLVFTLVDAEGKGNLCLDKKVFLQACLKLLDTPGLTEEMAAARAVRLIQQGRITAYEGCVYRSTTERAEGNLAYEIHRQMQGPELLYPGLEKALVDEDRRLSFTLSPEQKQAVKTALTSRLCVITGGPGTGKTSVQKAILDLYRRRNPAGKIVCCAPTGRAARRMEQSTGFSASTVHKALGLLAGDDGCYNEPEMLDADLVLVDEVSMLDVYLAGHLFRSIPRDCQLVLIGDADQLPSVGPGAVLSEIIASDRIPVVRLDRVYRQKDGSRIATNAKLIRHGNVGLEYGADFQFFDSSDMEASAALIEQLYLQETEKYGIDNVALLTPYRQKTATGVNALNDRLREQINPARQENPEIVCGKHKFRLGDKVMQVRNHEDINNGDVGYVTGITGKDSEAIVEVDFGDGRKAEYETSDLEMLDLGYASTIHKAQGSEYQSVIINLQCAHAVMLARPLIYTAITRAKERVLIVGERKAVCIAIKRTDTERRGTMLAKRIQQLSEQKGESSHGNHS